jgi:repressor of nif and glnA expression
MEALVQFAPLAVDGVFRSKDLHARVARALGKTTETYKSSQLRYDLSKLRAKGLVQKVEGTQGYRLTDEGYRVCSNSRSTGSFQWPSDRHTPAACDRTVLSEKIGELKS